MITLSSTDSIQAVAGTATAVTSTISGDEISAGVDTFKILDQRQLPTSAATLYTPGGSKTGLVKTWLLSNTTGSPVTVTLYLNGSAAANQIASILIPASGEAMLGSEGWKVFDANSALLTTVSLASNMITNTSLAQMPAHTYKGNNTGSTANAIDVTAAQLAADLPVATISTAGVMAANDKAKIDNLWYDVTNYGLVGNGSTDNVTAWNALFSSLPNNASVYFPAGTYNFASDIIISADKHLRIIGAGKYSTIIKSTTNAGHLFHINGPYWYNTFEDLRLEGSTSKTDGAGIFVNPGAAAAAVGINVYRCSFSNMFYGIYALANDTGAGTPGQAANLSIWDSLDISITGTTGPVNSRGIKINSGSTNLVISNSTINMGYPPFQVAGTAGIEINMSGAVQMVGNDFIGGTNTLLLNASSGGSSSVAAVFATNTFFDQSAGSTVKITGANIVNRVKFVQCGMTGGNVAGATAIEIANTGTGAAGTATAAADGIDIFDCDIYPNGGSGTMNGILVTGAQGVNISGNRISGWTNGINVTPAVSNAYTKVIINGNKMGATNNFTTPNTVGVLLNAGSFQYGPIIIKDNDFTGSTTALTDNSTIATSTQKSITSNTGLLDGFTAARGAFAGITTTVEAVVLQLPIPANTLKVGTIFRYTMSYRPAATTVITCRIRVGAAGTTGDASVVAMSATALTNAGTRVAQGISSVQAIGGSATHLGSGTEQVAAISAAGTASATSGTFNSAVANFVSVTLQNTSSTTTTLYGGTLEILTP